MGILVGIVKTVAVELGVALHSVVEGRSSVLDLWEGRDREMKTHGT